MKVNVDLDASFATVVDEDNFTIGCTTHPDCEPQIICIFNDVQLVMAPNEAMALASDIIKACTDADKIIEASKPRV